MTSRSLVKSPWKIAESLIFLLKCLFSNYVIEEYNDLEDPFMSSTSDKVLIMPLMLAAEVDPHTFYEMRKESSCKDVLYPEKTSALFMGNGASSVYAGYKLHQRLAFAFSELSAEQQNGEMGYTYDEELAQKSKENIKNVLIDIIHAFGLTPEDLK